MPKPKVQTRQPPSPKWIPKAAPPKETAPAALTQKESEAPPQPHPLLGEVDRSLGSQAASSATPMIASCSRPKRHCIVLRRQALQKREVHTHNRRSMLQARIQHRHKAAMQKQQEADLFTAILELHATTSKMETCFGKEPQFYVPQVGHDLASMRRQLQATISNFKDLLPFAEQIQPAMEVLEKVTRCPLSLAQLRKPMLAPDGQTYERSFINTWLRINPVSPVSREPMRRDQLIRNRPVESIASALSLLQKCLRSELDEESEVSSGEEEGEEAVVSEDEEASVQPVLVGPELLNAIENQEADLALELLGEEIDDVVLQGVFGEHHATLLQIALFKRLPAVALRLVNMLGRGTLTHFMGAAGPAISAFHLASSLGEVAVCEALLLRLGNSEVVDPTNRNLTILSCGEELHFHRYLNSIEIAELNGREEAAAFLSNARAAWLAEDE